MNDFSKTPAVRPTCDRIQELFNHSAPGDWVYHSPSDTFTLCSNGLVSIRGNHKRDYTLRYGQKDVVSLNIDDVLEHAGQVPGMFAG